MTVTIRPARLGDETGLQANCKTASSLEAVRQQVEWTVRESGFPRLAHFVAEFDRDVVGTVMLIPKGAHALLDSEGRLALCAGRQGSELTVGRMDDWVVAARVWRKGIGTALASRVVDEARAWGLRRIETSTSNPAAAAAMRTLGFSEFGALPLLGDSAEWHGGATEFLFYRDL